jgi:hypothetical protein
MEADESGDYVRWEDYERIEKRITAALAELREAAITQSAASWVRTHAIFILEGHADNE